MAEELDRATVEELPPFSFLKKPIKSIFAPSAISSILNKTSPDKRPQTKATFNNINYDEQIRAPRMSGVNNYTYEPESPRPFTDRKSLTLSRSDSHELVIMLAQKNDDEAAATAETTSQYFPATADLNQPTRRNLEPIKVASGLITSAVLTYVSNRYFEQPQHTDINDNQLNHNVHAKVMRRDSEASKNGRNDTAKENGIMQGYGKMHRIVKNGDSHGVGKIGVAKIGGSELSMLDTESVSDSLDTTVLMDRLKLMRAIQNLNSNTMTAERTEFKDGLGGRVRSPSMNSRGPGVQQVYNLKKPLSTPAVLRPTSREEDVDMDMNPALEPEELSALVHIAKYPFQLPESYDINAQQEPTHDHWMPNHALDHCMRCFGVFGNFFTPQRKRRHHCRFCGMLFCQDCLYKSMEMHYFQITTPEETSPQNSSVEGLVKTTSHRAYSGSSNGSSTTSNIVSGLLDEAVSGVMMDSKARFVVPLFPNLVGGTGTLMLHPRFKQCKTCKTCGSNYQKLVSAINQRLRTSKDSEAPYVFIENPYTSATYVGAQVHSTVSRIDKDRREERRGSLVNNVPSDWTWSSF